MSMNFSLTGKLLTVAAAGLSISAASGVQAGTLAEVDGRSVVRHTLVAPSETGASADTPLPVTLKQATDLQRRGEYQQAIAIYRLVLDSRNALDVELRAYVLSQIADVNIQRGMYTEAGTASNEAITLLRQAHKDHTGLFARAERVLADALYAGGYDQQARNIATEALALGRQTLDTRSPEFALFPTSLGQILKKLGKLGQAEELCQSALQILQRTQAADKIDLATAYQNVAVIQALRGHPRKALATIDLALATWSQVPPPQHPSVVYALCAKMMVYAKLKAFRQGEELMPHVMALSESLFGHNHPERVILLNNAAALYVAEKKYGDAEPLLREAADIAHHQLAAGHPMTRSTLLHYSYVLAKLNRKDEAARVRAESDVVRAGSAGDAPVKPTLTKPQDR
jgi:tetratricopeptide (TPR) repeat protein